MIVRAALVLLLSVAAPAAEVRVRLGTTHDVHSVELNARPEAKVRFCPACPSKPLRQPLRLVSGGKTLQLAPNRAARQVEVVGQWQLKFADGAIARGDSPLTIAAAGESLLLVERMPLEDYVAQVLDAEAGGFKNAEARRAMAVTVRTYALAFRSRHKGAAFELCDSTHCQALRPNPPSAASRDAAAATEGELLWYRGALAHTYYHRNCGGSTEDGRALEHVAVPYLQAKPDTFCIRDAERWRSQPLRAEIARALATIGMDAGSELHVEVASRTATGRVKALRVRAGGREQLLPEARFRTAVLRTIGWSTLQSDWYEMRDDGASFVFTGRGRGHGVGLCQAGSEQMAAAGKSYRDILNFYYPGTRVGLNAAGIDWQRFAGQRVEMLTTAAHDQALLATAETVLVELERSTGWTLREKPLLKIFPTIEMYRDATGAPGWLAAETRGRTIRLQPLRGRDAGEIRESLRHETAHVLISANASRPLPRWFQEGLAAALSGAEQPRVTTAAKLDALNTELTSGDAHRARDAYANATALVEGCIRKSGRGVVLGWVKTGLPSDLAGACAIGR